MPEITIEGLRLSMPEKAEYALFEHPGVDKSYHFFIPEGGQEYKVTFDVYQDQSVDLWEEAERSYDLNAYYSPEAYNLPVRELILADTALRALHYQYAIGDSAALILHTVLIESPEKKVKLAYAKPVPNFAAGDGIFLGIIHSMRFTKKDVGGENDSHPD